MNTIVIKKPDGSALDIRAKLLQAMPELGVKFVTEQFINPTVLENVEGEWIVRREIKVNMSSGSTHLEGLSATDEETKRLKETFSFDGYIFKKLRYNKTVDAKVWEGEGKIVIDTASLLMNVRERRVLAINGAIKSAVKLINTAGTGPTSEQITPATSMTVSGQALKDVNSANQATNFTAIPTVLTKTALKLDGTDASADIRKELEFMFNEITAIKKFGLIGTASAGYPLARSGQQVNLVIRTGSAFALVIANAQYTQQGNVANVALDNIQNGLAFKINGVSFVVDDAIEDSVLWEILPTGTMSPIYCPDRYKFTSALIDHPDMPSDFWRATSSASFGAVASIVNAPFMRVRLKAGATAVATYMA